MSWFPTRCVLGGLQFGAMPSRLPSPPMMHRGTPSWWERSTASSVNWTEVHCEAGPVKKHAHHSDSSLRTSRPTWRSLTELSMQCAVFYASVQCRSQLQCPVLCHCQLQCPVFTGGFPASSCISVLTSLSLCCLSFSSRPLVVWKRRPTSWTSTKSSYWC